MRGVALLVLGGCAALSASNETILVSRSAYLMGTRADLSIHAPARDAGLARLELALDALEDTEAELTTWRSTSAVSALNRQPVGAPWRASPGLCRLLGEVWAWHRTTGGAFDPAIGRLLEAWDVRGAGAVPTRRVLAAARAASGLPLLTLDAAACTVTRTADATLDTGAFGKGEALDRAAALLGEGPWMIDLGGQISVGGAPPEGRWTIAIADPRDRSVPAFEVRIASGSIATSAGSERDLTRDGTRIGHVLDPRAGTPAPFAGSVAVWDERGLVADILSTALYVMGPDAGLPWAEKHGFSACYLIPDGAGLRIEPTTGFRTLASGPE